MIVAIALRWKRRQVAALQTHSTVLCLCCWPDLSSATTLAL